jgi:hypothetical protein
MSHEAASGRGKSQDLRGLVLLLAAAIEGVHRYKYGTWPVAPAVVAIALVAFFTLLPRTMAAPARALTWVARKLGRVNNAIVLAVMFYLILAPVGMALRLFGSHRIERRPRPGQASYWKDRPDRGAGIDFRRMH